MSEFSRETLLNIIETDHVQCGEASALARMALAAMDSEPVAWLLSGGGTKNVVCFDSGNAYADPLREVTQLYRHAQQPVVSAELLHTAASAIEDLLTTKDRMGVYVCFDLPFRLRSAANAQPVPVAYSDFESFWSSYIHPLAQDDELKDFAWDIWNAYRAAMLAAAQHDTPALNPVQSVVTVPGSWIPASERMPKVGQEVLCVDQFENYEVALYDTAYIPEPPFFSITTGEFHPTHWMPLPAAPQGVKGE
ncbi:DUF551 domain-containing protein [Klebsiella pneumoniae]|uniref:DUF551 domain-containing protein n=1 Tax=Klebsiella pneumoniae TaxID=573 RepID=UPI001F5FB829|nr:DUF551 domain-containing protein [Klebsiella pneumoniae]